MSTSVYYKDAKLIDVNNNTKTLLTAGKYLEDDVILTDVTVHQTHTVTITGQGNIYQGYIEYNNVKYYSSGDVINVSDGDTITIYLDNGYTNYLSINGVRVAGGYSQTVDYTYSVTFDAEIKFSLLTGQSDVYLTESDIQALSVIENGTYTASGTTRGYSPVKVNVPNPSTSSLTVTPTESQQTFNATGVYGYKPVTVNAISSTYVGTNISRRDGDDIIWDLNNGYIEVPSGYYSDGVPLYITTESRPKPTIGISSTTGVVTATHQMSVGRYVPATYSSIVTSTYSLPIQAAQTFYPSTADRTISSYRWLTGAQTIKSVTTSNLTAENIVSGTVVKVGDTANASRIAQVTGTYSGIIPSGTSEITSNGTYNVYGYASANINVSTTPSEQYYKATLMNYGATNFRNYIRYNNKNYYQSGSTFYFKAGDTISYYGESITGSYVYSDDTQIYSSTAITWAYNYTAPAHPLDIMFSSGVRFNSPTISIGSNGIYDVTDYASASVNVAPTYTATITKGSPVGISVYYNNTLYSSTGSTFTYSPGDNLSVYIYQYNSKYSTTELLINGETVVKNTDGTTISYNYSLPATNINLSLNYGFSPYNQLHIAEQIIPSNTLTGLSYGICNVYGYSSVDTRYGELAIYKALANGDGVVMTGGTSYTSTDAINYCNSLTNISANQFIHRDFVPSGATFENVTNIGIKAFASVYYGTVSGNYQGSLTYSFPNVSNISSMAFLSNLFIRSIYANNCSFIGENAFCGCRSLMTISFSNCSVISSGAFDYCSLLSKANFPVCETIGGYGFRSCYNLSSISFPNCTYVGDSAFYSCRALTTVDIPNCTYVGNYAFNSCTALTTASFPNCTRLGNNAFSNCTALTIASFPSCSSIGMSAFSNCSALTTAYFPNCTYVSDYAFRNCFALTTINFPSAASIGGYAFQYCSSLTTVSFPNAISIGSSAFAYCTALTTAEFPKARSIGSYAFASCSVLTTISFPSVTNIGTYAFYRCHPLTIASFPSATSIGNSAFGYCYSFLSLYLLGSSVPTLGTGAFVSTPIGGYTTSTGGVYGSIFVPSSLYDQYIVATNWSAHSARIVSV